MGGAQSHDGVSVDEIPNLATSRVIPPEFRHIRLWLEVVSGPLKGKKFKVSPRRSAVIGRDRNNRKINILVPGPGEAEEGDPLVSRLHAIVEFDPEDGMFWVHSESVKGRTLVSNSDGVVLEELRLGSCRFLHDGDYVVVSRSKFQCFYEGYKRSPLTKWERREFRIAQKEALAAAQQQAAEEGTLGSSNENSSSVPSAPVAAAPLNPSPIQLSDQETSSPSAPPMAFTPAGAPGIRAQPELVAQPVRQVEAADSSSKAPLAASAAVAVGGAALVGKKRRRKKKKRRRVDGGGLVVDPLGMSAVEMALPAGSYPAGSAAPMVPLGMAGGAMQMGGGFYGMQQQQQMVMMPQMVCGPDGRPVFGPDGQPIMAMMPCVAPSGPAPMVPLGGGVAVQQQPGYLPYHQQTAAPMMPLVGVEMQEVGVAPLAPTAPMADPIAETNDFSSDDEDRGGSSLDALSARGRSESVSSLYTDVAASPAFEAKAPPAVAASTAAAPPCPPGGVDMLGGSPTGSASTTGGASGATTPFTRSGLSMAAIENDNEGDVSTEASGNEEDDDMMAPGLVDVDEWASEVPVVEEDVEVPPSPLPTSPHATDAASLDVDEWASEQNDDADDEDATVEFEATLPEEEVEAPDSPDESSPEEITTPETEIVQPEPQFEAGAEEEDSSSTVAAEAGEEIPSTVEESEPVADSDVPEVESAVEVVEENSPEACEAEEEVAEEVAEASDAVVEEEEAAEKLLSSSSSDVEDSDAKADAKADSDVEADAKADSDVEADAKADSDVEADAEASDAEADSDAKSDSDAEASDTEADSDAETDSDAKADSDAETNSDEDDLSE